MLDVVERSAGLREFSDFTGVHVEETRGAGLFDGDIDRTEPCPVHACKRFQVGAGVDDGDVHLDADLTRLLKRDIHGGRCLLQTEFGHG